MKKTLLLFSTVVTLYANGQTSVYHPFPDSAAMWNIESNKACGLYFDNWAYLYSLTITGDTIINGINYHKLQVPIEVIISNGQCATFGTWTNPGYYAGGIRQEILNKKVFFIPPTDTTEQLLYDFNMQVGDTVRGYIENSVFPDDIVQSIDSILVGSDYRKRWRINPYYNIDIIEGIGSTYGLIEQSPGNVSDNNVYIISCFSENGLTLYSTTTTSCQLITAVNAMDKPQNVVNVFPNPSNGALTVDFDQPINVCEIQLTDLLGNIILDLQTNNQKVFKIKYLSNGTYILTVLYKDGSTINKKIISSH